MSSSSSKDGTGGLGAAPSVQEKISTAGVGTLEVILDWNRISVTFLRTGPDSLWTGAGLHCRIRFKLGGIGLRMG